eukprot:TRINITY_DN3042_c0_g1_i3.p1 TRINITY_DN3042_c0_g1~~TRINITY_DN3042_c0_g1_i3.p1  ORF type:complete len:624 (+),score=34.09 TRINITY_DN3042_c0_g1_i3:250-2121(+)
MAISAPAWKQARFHLFCILALGACALVHSKQEGLSRVPTNVRGLASAASTTLARRSLHHQEEHLLGTSVDDDIYQTSSEAATDRSIDSVPPVTSRGGRAGVDSSIGDVHTSEDTQRQERELDNNKPRPSSMNTSADAGSFLVANVSNALRTPLELTLTNLSQSSKLESKPVTIDDVPLSLSHLTALRSRTNKNKRSLFASHVDNNSSRLTQTEVLYTDEDAPAKQRRKILRSPLERCHNIDNSCYGPSPDTLIPWRPRRNRYLVAICSHGRMGNRLMCLRKYVVFAALMNRTLVIPRFFKDEYMYDLDWVFDVKHARKCLGKRTVISVEEYLREQKKDVMEVFLKCWWGNCHIRVDGAGRCLLVQKAIPEIKPKPGSCEKTDAAMRLPLAEFNRLFASVDEEVFSFGDLFPIDGISEIPHQFLGVEDPLELAAEGPCAMAMRPDEAILESARGFIRSHIGDDPYLAVHLRRGDFWEHNINSNFHMWLSARKLGTCIGERLRRINNEGPMTTIFMATNGNDDEIDFLMKTVKDVSKVKSIRLVRMQPHHFQEAWASPLVERGWRDHQQAQAEVGKTVGAMSKVLLGSWGSTFSATMYRLKNGLVGRSCHDAYICGSVEENVVHP